MSDVVYLYGIVAADAPAPPADLVGLAGVPVGLAAVGSLAARIARLPGDRYGPQTIDARLSDLGWVGEQGLDHERVVLWFVDRTDILPARLFTMYPDEDALRAALEPQHDSIERSLTALAGRREWNLKAAYDADTLGRRAGDVSAPIRGLDDEIAAAPPGRRYLLERRRSELLKREVVTAARRLADDLLHALQQHAEAVRVLPLAAAEESGSVVLSAALLVHRDAESALRADADARSRDLQELGMVIRFSGPWAPYRFLEDPVDV